MAKAWALVPQLPQEAKGVGAPGGAFCLAPVVQPEGPVCSSDKVSKSHMRTAPGLQGVALLEELSLELLPVPFAHTSVPRLGEGRAGVSVTRALVLSWQQPQEDVGIIFFGRMRKQLCGWDVFISISEPWRGAACQLRANRARACLACTDTRTSKAAALPPQVSLVPKWV